MFCFSTPLHVIYVPNYESCFFDKGMTNPLLRRITTHYFCKFLRCFYCICPCQTICFSQGYKYEFNNQKNQNHVILNFDCGCFVTSGH